MQHVSDWGAETHKCTQNIQHFTYQHIHYGWYPQITLDTRQQQVLSELISDAKYLEFDAPEDVIKWPLCAYLLHLLVFTPGQRVAVVASTQREANRRYQGLLYPYDHLPQYWERSFEIRTSQEMHLETGSYIKTFTTDTKKHIAGFKPDVLIVEDTQVGNVAVKPSVRVIQVTLPSRFR